MALTVSPGTVQSMDEHGRTPLEVATRRAAPERLDLSQPRWDQSTFYGRACFYYATVNPRNLLASNAQLDDASALVRAYCSGQEPRGTTAAQVWRAKDLYDSAFHPDTGEKLFLAGRMSFQVPGNMIISGCMMARAPPKPERLCSLFFKK